MLAQLTRRDVLMLVKLALTGNLLFYTLLSAAIQLAGAAYWKQGSAALHETLDD